MKYLAKMIDRNMFVKKLANGEPCFYSTWNRSEAAEFTSEAEALEWANGLFRGKGEAKEIESTSERAEVSRPIAGWDYFNDEPNVDTERHLNAR